MKTTCHDKSRKRTHLAGRKKNGISPGLFQNKRKRGRDFLLPQGQDKSIADAIPDQTMKNPAPSLVKSSMNVG